MNFHFFYRVIFCLMPLAACVVFSGCPSSSGPSMHAVRGTLTHKGEPIPQMLICFDPVDRDKNPASEAKTDEKGAFELKVGNTKGVMTGEYIIYVQDPAAVQGGKTSTEPAYLEVLKKYGDPVKSEMRITIEKAKNDYELKLD